MVFAFVELCLKLLKKIYIKNFLNSFPSTILISLTVCLEEAQLIKNQICLINFNTKVLHCFRFLKEICD